jgi:hypothetical protein
MKRQQLTAILGILSTASLGLMAAILTEDGGEEEAVLVSENEVIVDQYVKKAPVRPQILGTPQAICQNEKIRVLAKLRKFCTGGSCDIDAFIRDAVNISENDFLEIISGLPRTTFFYCKSDDTVSQKQIDQKASDLITQLTTMLVDKENSMAFVLGKASSVGTQTDIEERKIFNKELSARRTQNISTMIIDKLEETGRKQMCADIYKAYVGEQAFTFSNKLSNQLYHARDREIFKAECGSDEKFEDYINQSVVVFAYPCLWEMCLYLKDNDGLSCEDSSSRSLPDECKPYLCP